MIDSREKYKSIKYSIQVTVCKSINEEMVTEIKNIAACPFLWCDIGPWIYFTQLSLLPLKVKIQLIVQDLRIFCVIYVDSAQIENPSFPDVLDPPRGCSSTTAC